MVGFGAQDRIAVTFDTLDTNHDGRISAADRGTALVTRTVEGTAVPGLLIDLGAVTQLVPIQRQEIFLASVDHLTRDEVVTIYG